MVPDVNHPSGRGILPAAAPPALVVHPRGQRASRFSGVDRRRGAVTYGSRMTVRAVIFDAYGTLFDVYSVAALGEALFPGHGERLAAVWRDKQVEYSRLVTMSGGPGPGGSEHYRPFWALTRDALRYAARLLDLPWSTDVEDRLMSEYRQLRAFPENRDVLVELRRRQVPTAILSNGDPQMLTAAVRAAGLAELLDHVISVDTVRRYKTDPAAYALGTTALGLPADQIMFVSSNCWDAIGATWFGYRTLWVNRAGLPLDPLGTTPTHIGTTLHDVLALVA